jgi:DNA-binding CsgD family transcriptional regulator
MEDGGDKMWVDTGGIAVRKHSSEGARPLLMSGQQSSRHGMFGETVAKMLAPDTQASDAADTLSCFASSLGFDHFSFAIAPTAGYDGTSGIILTDYSAKWLSKYRSGAYHDGDPLLTQSRTEYLPFRWSGRAYLKRVDKYPRSLMMEAMEFGILAGFTVPVRGISGELGVLTGVYTELAVEDEGNWRPGYEWLVSIAPFVLSYAMSQIDRHTTTGDAVVLSDHEQTCLSWTLKGKTSWEIAQIIGRSRPTVEYHLQKAMRKLQASNKAHAAAIALKRGLM